MRQAYRTRTLFRIRHAHDAFHAAPRLQCHSQRVARRDTRHGEPFRSGGDDRERIWIGGEFELTTFVYVGHQRFVLTAKTLLAQPYVVVQARQSDFSTFGRPAIGEQHQALHGKLVTERFQREVARLLPRLCLQSFGHCHLITIRLNANSERRPPLFKDQTRNNRGRRFRHPTETIGGYPLPDNRG